MFTLFIRGAVLYGAMILVMRGLGKRQLGEFQPFELAMTILLADVISAPMESVSVPLLNGLLPVAAMFVVHALVSLLAARFDGVRAVVSGKPTVVINRGVIDRDALDKLCLSLSDLLEGLRGVPGSREGGHRHRGGQRHDLRLPGQPLPESRNDGAGHRNGLRGIAADADPGRPGAEGEPGALGPGRRLAGGAAHGSRADR